MKATEKVRKGNLRGNTAFYLDNPIECDYRCLPRYASDPKIADDDEVWILYFSEAHRQSYFKQKAELQL